MFSSRQLSEMLDLAENAREQLINDLASLGNESISAKVNLNSDKNIIRNLKFLILFCKPGSPATSGPRYRVRVRARVYGDVAQMVSALA